MATIRIHYRLVVALLATIFFLSFVNFTYKHQQEIRNTFSYATRPLWDADASPQTVVPHFHADGLNISNNAEYVCELHGWSVRPALPGSGGVKVLDAVLLSSEMDLLEIRMHELDSVVDKFLLLESNATFTGLEKEVFFEKNRDRFMKFRDKIVYRFLPGFPLRKDQSPWGVEAATRDSMTDLIRQTIAGFPTDTQTLVIMSDVDEIPSKHTIQLLKTCNFGSKIHLQLRNYLYSFEWYIGLSSWRTSFSLWDNDSYYRHSKSTEVILADSGWHCSYCFRTIKEYVLKMRGFSHADRIAGRINLLDEGRIQDVICKGKDIFGMLPEAYSYLDLFSQMSLAPLKTAVGLPQHLVENAPKFSFLLPGGCRRDHPSSQKAKS